MSDNTKLFKVDIGCGSNKKEGCLGIDYEKFENVDIVLDLTAGTIPLDDRSVGYIHSAHFFEHIRTPNHVFSEISRIAADGAELEIWTPYAYSDGAFCYGHEVFLTEEHWQHICVKFPDFYQSIINARWLLKKIVYIVERNVYDDIRKNGFEIAFAINYFKGIVSEFGVFIEIKHEKNLQSTIPKRYYSFERGGEVFPLDYNPSRTISRLKSIKPPVRRFWQKLAASHNNPR